MNITQQDLETLEQALGFIEVGARPRPKDHICGDPNACCDDLCVASASDNLLVHKMRAFHSRAAAALASRPVPEAVGLPEGCPERLSWGFVKYPDGKHGGKLMRLHDPAEHGEQECARAGCIPVEIHHEGTRHLASLRSRLASMPVAGLTEVEARCFKEVDENIIKYPDQVVILLEALRRLASLTETGAGK